MSGTEGAWLQSLESNRSCLVLDHSSLSRWEMSSLAEEPAHWVTPFNKSDSETQINGNSWRFKTIDDILDGNQIMALLKGHFGPSSLSLICIKTSRLEITSTW